jgi:hypothetical protein
VSLLCWRSGGANTPTIRRLHPVSPSPTFAHSSALDAELDGSEPQFALADLQNELRTNGIDNDLLGYLLGLGLSDADLQNLVSDALALGPDDLINNPLTLDSLFALIDSDLQDMRTDVLFSTANQTPVPEPSSWLLLLSALAIVVAHWFKNGAAILPKLQKPRFIIKQKQNQLIINPP